jgi:hypothetical protein
MKKRWLAALPLAVGALIFATAATGSGKPTSGGIFRVARPGTN